MDHFTAIRRKQNTERVFNGTFACFILIIAAFIVTALIIYLNNRDELGSWSGVLISSDGPGIYSVVMHDSVSGTWIRVACPDEAVALRLSCEKGLHISCIGSSGYFQYCGLSLHYTVTGAPG